jgi:hypothetical protein
VRVFRSARVLGHRLIIAHRIPACAADASKATAAASAPNCVPQRNRVGRPRHERREEITERERETSAPATADPGRESGRRILQMVRAGPKPTERPTCFTGGTPLAYLADGENWVIFVANSGRPTHPGWYYNLCENPAAAVELASGTYKVTARESSGHGTRRFPRPLQAVLAVLCRLRAGDGARDSGRGLGADAALKRLRDDFTARPGHVERWAAASGS